MCTSFRLKAKNGTILVGRTMEFAADLGWQLMTVPIGTQFIGTSPSGAGHLWETTHGFLGISALGRRSAVDGLNDAGLYAGLLYLPGFAEYQAHEGVSPERLVAPDEVASLALSTSASVEEAVATIELVTVWDKFEEQLKGTLPIHLVLHDRSGGFAVVEWVDGACSVHRSSLGVCTNSPPYAWHETNLRNYVNLSRDKRGPGGAGRPDLCADRRRKRPPGVAWRLDAAITIRTRSGSVECDDTSGRWPFRNPDCITRAQRVRYSERSSWWRGGW